MEQNLDCKFLLQIYLGSISNPSSAYDRKAYVIFIAIRPSDGDFKPAVPFVLFIESRLMPAQFPLSPFLFLDAFSNLVTHHSATWPAEVVQKLKMGPSFAGSDAF